MKIKILKQDLYKHITIAQKAVSNKSTILILENIKFEAKDNKLILSSTDLELSIETSVDCEVLEEGTILIKSNIIGNIINKMPQDIITITVKEDKVNIKCQNSIFDIQGQFVNEYPPLPDIEEKPILELENSELIKSIRETVFATSNDEARLAYTGILFESTNEKIVFVGLDGYRMAMKTLEYKNDSSFSSIVPKRAFNELTRILDESTTQITVVEGHILFTNGDTKIYSRLIDKKYIDYEKLVNKDYNTKIIVNKNDLINSLERAQMLALGNTATLTKFAFEDGIIHINSNSDFGKLDEKIFAKQEGANLEIAFNTKYILDGLKVIDEDEILLHLTTSLAPMNIYPINSDNEYLYLVLPVRLSK